MASKLFFLLLAVVAAAGIGFYFYSSGSDPGLVLHGTAYIGDPNQSPNVIDFMVQGSHIYVDQNGDGVPQADEELPDRKVPTTTNATTGMTFTITKIDLGVAPESVSETLPQRLLLYIDIGKETQYTMSGTMVVTPEKRNWLQFGGPMEFLEMEKLSLKKSKQPEEVKLFIGSIATGSAPNDKSKQSDPAEPFRTTIVIPTEQPPFPKGSITFEVPDSQPIIREFTMDHFC